MGNRASTWRMALWFMFVAYCALGMGLGPHMPQTLIGFGGASIKVADVLLGVALLLGMGPLLYQAGQPRSSWTRSTSRIVLVYLLYETLVVLPIAWWFAAADLSSILREMWVRLVWVLFPVVVAVCSSDRAERLAAKVAILAAACVAVWGLLLLATGSAGAFLYAGDTRFRVLWGGSTLLFAWPFALAVSGACSRRWAAVLSAVGVVGLLLANHRSGYLAFGAAGLFCLATSGRLGRLWRWAIPAAAGLAIIILASGSWLQVRYGYVLNNLVNTGDKTAANRLSRWSAAWASFENAPLGDFVWTWRAYLPNKPFASNYLAHNFFMEIAQTQGLPGLLFVCAVLASAFYAASGWVRRDARLRALAGFLLAVVVFNLFNTTFSNPITAPLMVAAVAAIVARADRLRSSAEAGGRP